MRVFKKVLLVLFIAAQAHAGGQTTEPPKEFFEDCLNSSNNKYELYNRCIGKFTNACIENPEKYESIVADLEVGTYSRNCIERESLWWTQVYKSQSKQLQKNAKSYLNDKRILNAVHSTLSALDTRHLKECRYVTTRWGYRGDDLVQVQGINDQFSCIRDIEAENAINAWRWNNHLIKWKNIK